jgi:lipid-A-disaccharide synthase
MVVSTAGIVASGTATLECAIEELPIVVCYKMSTVSWFLAKILVSLKFSSIVNIIANEKIVPELLQNQMNSKNLVAKIKPLLNLKTNVRNKMISKFHPLKGILGKPGVYDRVANSIIKKMNHNK